MSSHVLVVLAVYRPDPAHLQAQLQALSEQTGCSLRVIAVVADTVSDALVDRLAADLDLDLVCVRSDQELDAVRAFETGLAEAVIEMDAGQGPEPLIAL